MELHIKTAPTPKSYHKNACDFCEAAWRCYSVDGKLIENGKIKCFPVQTIVNAAFSCEMNLKALLLSDDKEFPKGRDGHDLELLFLELEKETRELISSFCMQKSSIDPYSDFLRFLQIHKDDFTRIRYYMEESEWQEMSPLTMLTIAENLSSITGALIEQ